MTVTAAIGPHRRVTENAGRHRCLRAIARNNSRRAGWGSNVDRAAGIQRLKRAVLLDSKRAIRRGNDTLFRIHRLK